MAMRELQIQASTQNKGGGTLTVTVTEVRGTTVSDSRVASGERSNFFV